jgi:hypothetical protein
MPQIRAFACEAHLSVQGVGGELRDGRRELRRGRGDHELSRDARHVQAVHALLCGLEAADVLGSHHQPQLLLSGQLKALLCGSSIVVSSVQAAKKDGRHAQPQCAWTRCEAKFNRDFSRVSSYLERPLPREVADALELRTVLDFFPDEGLALLGELGVQIL